MANPSPSADALLDTLIVFATAQQWFETRTETGAVNTFCTLVPLVLEDGSPAREADFPNNGLVWWKLLAASKTDAVPGRLFAGYIEHAIVYAPDDPTKQYYQAVGHQIAPLDPGDAVEILTVRERAVATARELVNTPGVVELDHPPSELVLVRWRGELYGPLKTSIAASGDGQYRISLVAEDRDGWVFQLADIPAGTRGHVRLNARISSNDQPPYRSQQVRTASYELALRHALERVDTGTRRRVLLLRDDELILRAARRLLVGAERQRLAELLERVGTLAQTDPGAEAIEIADVIAAVRRRVAADSAAVSSLADALLSSNALTAALADAVQRHAERHVEANAASLRAQIEERVAAERRRLEELGAERDDLESELHSRRRAEERALGEALDVAWREHRARVEAELVQVGAERERLDEQGRALAERLSRIAGSFSAEHERLLGDALLLLPVLQRAAADMGSAIVPGLAAAPVQAAPDDEPLQLPPFVQTGAAQARGAPSEAAFFERFTAYASASGNEYDALELGAFHVAMKCGDVVLAGGASGAGATELARQYAQALGGEQAARWLSVPVQATWLDLQDVVGGVNPHARLFEPAATGIFAFLAAAAAEYAQHAGDSGVYVLCLDEFDRAAPELYLSALLHALEQPPDARVLRCFDPHAVRPRSALARWSSMLLPPSLRVVGTLAGDDSARPLLLSVRDRAHEIPLRGYAAGGLSARDNVRSADAAPAGPPVTLRALQRWVRDGAPPEPWAELFDRVRALLREANADLTPRAVRLAHRFIVNAGDTLPVAAAMDVQLVQRVVPRLAAALGTTADPGLLERMNAALEANVDALPLTLAALRQVREESS